MTFTVVLPFGKVVLYWLLFLAFWMIVPYIGNISEVMKDKEKRQSRYWTAYCFILSLPWFVILLVLSIIHVILCRLVDLNIKLADKIKGMLGT